MVAAAIALRIPRASIAVHSFNLTPSHVYSLSFSVVYIIFILLLTLFLFVFLFLSSPLNFSAKTPLFGVTMKEMWTMFGRSGNSRPVLR